jgi:hypothetical protein
MYTKFRLPLLAVALLAGPTWTLRAGEIYRSVDAEGHVVYSDHPDPSAASQSAVQIPDSEPVADVEVRATEVPPDLQENEQPPCPDEGYLWTPGYWAWNAGGYYWLPGAWVQPPRVDVVWTPGYWEFVGAAYIFHRGYWAEHIGYYGGINYGFGYFGVGFAGGRWVNHAFAYNRSVSNLGARVTHNTYSESVHGNATFNRVSYNGGPGGTTSLMTAREREFTAERHFPATSVQRQYSTQAARTQALMAHMPVSVYHSEVSAEHREVEATQRETTQRPGLMNGPAVAERHGPATSALTHQRELAHAPSANRALVQSNAARPGKPASTRPALSRSLNSLHSTKN